MHDRGHIIYDENGNATRMIGATQDITARKSAENKLIQERLARQNEITNAVLTAQATSLSVPTMESNKQGKLLSTPDQI